MTLAVLLLPQLLRLLMVALMSMSQLAMMPMLVLRLMLMTLPQLPPVLMTPLPLVVDVVSSPQVLASGCRDRSNGLSVPVLVADIKANYW